jgi:hypothetical protein
LLAVRLGEVEGSVPVAVAEGLRVALTENERLSDAEEVTLEVGVGLADAQAMVPSDSVVADIGAGQEAMHWPLAEG